MGQQNSQLYKDEVIINGVELKEVKYDKMEQLLHRNIAALIWRDPKYHKVGRGTGMFISKNLLITSAHNFFNKAQKVPLELFEIYPKQSGKLAKCYKIQQIYMPNEYEQFKDKKKSVFYDYALVKIKDSIDSKQFITLSCITQNKGQTLALYGYPGCKYENVGEGHENIAAITQWGLTQEKAIVEIKQNKGRIIYAISSLEGQSGSPVIQVAGNNLRVIAIQKGGIATKIEGQEISLNFGRLITKDMLKELSIQAINMGAEMFKTDLSNPEAEQANQAKQANVRTPIKEVSAKVAVQPKLQKKTTSRTEEQKLSAFEQFQKGEELQKNNQFQQAYECYQRAQRKNKIDFSVYKQMGKCLTQMKRWQEAILNYKKSIELKKDDPITHAWLGYALDQAHRYEEAVTEYRIAIFLNPKDAVTNYNLGIVLSHTNRNKQAIDCYEKALEIDPNYYSALIGIADAHYELKNYEQAIKYYQKVLEKNPTKSSVYKNMGMAYSATQRNDQAINCYRKAIQLDPNNFSAHISLGNELSEKNKVEEAIECYRYVIQKDRNNYRPYFSLANIYYKIDKYEEAIEQYLNALEIDPNVVECNFNLGLAYKAIKKRSKAIQYFQKCLSINKNYSSAEQQLDRIMKGE